MVVFLVFSVQFVLVANGDGLSGWWARLSRLDDWKLCAETV